MVGGLFLAALLAVDLAGDESVGGLRRQQEMVDAKPFVARPAPGLIVPEGVLDLVVERAPGFSNSTMMVLRSLRTR